MENFANIDIIRYFITKLYTIRILSQKIKLPHSNM